MISTQQLGTRVHLKGKWLSLSLFHVSKQVYPDTLKFSASISS